MEMETLTVGSKVSTAAEEEADGSFRKAQSFREGIHPRTYKGKENG